MRHLLSVWQEIEPLIRERSVMLLLDYDGTLTPLVSPPRVARISPAGKKILRALGASQGVKTAVVSGRKLAELKELVAFLI